MEEQILRERLEKMHLTHETCVEKTGGCENLYENIRAIVNDVATMQRNMLMQEPIQLRKNVDDNDRKLA
ncbi:hypothetical protein EAI_17075 [Harpegnathos saltator]|uniref:Uncharacterized protein n=1 Tax=Harpegnathos saltator TaxID=610380 RepID=E2BM11_HARSA|nr:hypothetical protein EAI_17075 [Harpegnathos saltator]